MAELRHTLTFPQVVMYGIGTMVGAGIYVLVGKVAGSAGMLTPWSFVIAAALATLSALSYAELSSRYPESAGAALYIYHGFGRRWLSTAVGVLIMLSGIVSAGVMAHGFGSYLQVLVPGLPSLTSALLVIAVLGIIALIGIKQSVHFITTTTIVSLLGLLYIMRIARDAFTAMAIDPSALFSRPAGSWMAVIGGSFLAFYAFIGFEDLANVSEELKHPTRDMPWAIITIMIAATILYVLVALVAVYGMPLSDLQGSSTPLADLYRATGSGAPWIITIISIFSVLNGLMVQVLMGSRLLYGMASKGRVPARLGHVSTRSQVPTHAIYIIIAIIALFVVILPMVQLAQLTSLLILTIFLLVNLSLCRIKRREKQTPVTSGSHFVVSWIVPVLGVIATLGLLIIVAMQAMG